MLKTRSPAQRARAFGRCLLCLLAGVLLCLPAARAQAAYRVELTAPAELKDLLSEHLDLFRYRARDDINADQFNYMIATTVDQVAKLAATQGYFSPKTTIKLTQLAGTSVVALTVEAGQRTMVSKLDINVRGAAATHSPAQVSQVQKNRPLSVGQPFQQQEWDETKQEGLEILQQRHYPAARIADSQARVYADFHEADLAINYDSGPLFTFGDVTVSGTSRYPERIIANVNPLGSGEEYSLERLLEFQHQILRTPYFSNAVVTIDRDAESGALAPVKVQVTEYPTQQIQGGVGYTTDTGAHVEGRYAHNNMFGRAWVLNAQTRVEQERQLGALELAMPPARGGFVNSGQISTERTTLEGVDLRSRRVGLRRARISDKNDTAYTLQYFRDRLEQLNDATLPPEVVVQPGTHQALVAGIEKTWRGVDDLVFPRKGRIVSVQAGVALKGLLTDQSFVRLYGRMQQFLPVGRRDLVILRAEAGSILSKGGNASIPASLLFRAGGSDSVRGYDYQSIGNKRNGTVYPTRFLATGSVEYQHWFSEKWGAAVFYDVGLASDRWRDQTLFHAVGFGARWRTPLGRIQGDLAYRFQDNKIRPHLALGVTF